MPLVYIPSSYPDSPFGATFQSYRNSYHQPYAPPQDEGYDFSYAALINRQREYELQRQRREEARMQRERQRELRLKQERERLIREMIQQRELQRYRQHHNQRNLERQYQTQQQPHHRIRSTFHPAHRADPMSLSTPIQARSPMERPHPNISGVNHRPQLDDDFASTDEDASEEEYEDSEKEQDEQPKRSLSNLPSAVSFALQTQSEIQPQPQPQPQPSRSLNRIIELEQTLNSLLGEKLPSLNRLQLEGHLTNLLLEADRVDPHGEPDEDAVREKRRELVRAVERVLGGEENAKGSMDLDVEESTVEEEEVESQLQPLTI